MEILIIKNNHTILDWESKLPITKYQNVEVLSSNLTKNKKHKRFLITLLGLSLYAKNVFAASDGIDKLGWTLLGLIRHWAYWILLIMCIVEVIKSGLNGDSKKSLPIIMKFVVIFASMYLIPVIFDAIVKAFV